MKYHFVKERYHLSVMFIAAILAYVALYRKLHFRGEKKEKDADSPFRE